MTEFANEYGEGLFLLGQEEKCTDILLDEATRLNELFIENEDFCRLLSNLSIPAAERLHILESALAERVHPYLFNFLCILLRRGMLNEFSLCVQKFRSLYYEANHIIDAVVYTPILLSENKLSLLRTQLQNKSGRSVRIVQRVDKTLLGGIRVDMDGQTYDNTVSHRLSDLRRMLTDVE